MAMFADEACMSQSSDRYRCWEGILTEENTWGSFGCLPGEAHGLEQTIESRLEDWVAAAGSKVMHVQLLTALGYDSVFPWVACGRL